jgi:dCMP deaminase
MEMAELVASKSKDPATKVGCVIVASDQVVAATGYNGIPRGVEDKPERMERPAKYLWTSHAEENAVAHAARTGVSLKGSTAFVTHKPCCRCARMLIQAGVVEVVVGDGTTSMPIEEFHTSDVMLKEAGVKVTDLLTDV